MNSLLEPGGIALVSTRDYDAILEERPTSTAVVHNDNQYGDRVTFQLWRWQEQTPIYEFRLFILLRRKRRWKTITTAGTYHAYRRDEIESAFLKAGFEGCTWLRPEDSGYFQQVMIARK
jgi:glycine/sarcosine N-methyltransferase